MFDKTYYDETRFDMKIHDCEFSYGYIYSGKDFDIKERLDYFDLESIVERGMDADCLRLMLGFYTEESFEEFLNGGKASPTVYKKIDELLNGKA